MFKNKLKSFPGLGKFTFNQLMLFVVILGLIAAYIRPKYSTPIPDRKTSLIQKARMDLRILNQALDMYLLDNYHYPSADQGLQALISKPSGDPKPKNYNEKGYILKEELLHDPWNNPYQYRNPGHYGKIDIFSFGPDKHSKQDDIGY